MNHRDVPLQAQGSSPQNERQVERADVPPIGPRDSWWSRSFGAVSIHVIALLMPASIFGVLARLGLLSLGTYEGQSVFSLAYVQGLGCFIIGFAAPVKESFGEFYAPLYTALTTGFCGSLTTFSSWQLDVFDSWININDAHRGGLRDFMDGLGKTVFTLCISLGSVTFGMALSSWLSPYFPKLRPIKHITAWVLTALAILTYAATFPPYFRLAPHIRHQATSALLFSFPGTLTRYVLYLLLNSVSKTIPVGTLAANSLGTALIGAFRTLQTMSRHPVSPNSCSVLQGLLDGYCGCLTTVSTFALEAHTLGVRKGTVYVVLSWVVGQVLLVLIMGPALWTGHAEKGRTCSFV